MHLAELREPYAQESYFNKTTLVSYDYEPIYALGTLLGVGDPEQLLRLLIAVEDLGVDAISCGVSLAWATEAFQKGFITQKETLVSLKWGDATAYLDAIRHILLQDNAFYQTLALGSVAAAKVYGGLDFAMAYGNNEMAGYHTGPTAALGFLYGTRHSHLDSGPYSFDQQLFNKKKPVDPDQVAQYILTEESWRQVLTSLVICLFARKVYDTPSVIKALQIMGFSVAEPDLQRMGQQIYAAKTRYKQAAGVNFDALQPPARIFETPSPLGKIDPKVFEQCRQALLTKIRQIL